MSAGAISLWVRSIVRRQLVATVFLGVLAGVVGGLVVAALDANNRAATSLDRFLERNHSYDVIVMSCPPGIDIERDGFDVVRETCLSQAGANVSLDLLAAMPEVEIAAVGTNGTTLATIDPVAPHGLGHIGLMSITGTPGVPWIGGNPIVVEGRLADTEAPDEAMIDETYARVTGSRIGDVIHAASWSQDRLDAGVNGLAAPNTRVSELRVVGIVRYPEGLQNQVVDVSRVPTGGSVSAGAVWSKEYADEYASYGWGVAVRLHDGPASLETFAAALDLALADRIHFVEPYQGSDFAPVRTTIDMERAAVTILAAIVAGAGVVFVGLSIARQMRRDAEASSTLHAMGLTRAEFALAGALRGAPVALVAGATTVLVAILLSPLAPVGKAREAEEQLGIHFAALLALAVAVCLMAWIVVLCVLNQIRWARTQHTPPTHPSFIGSRVGRMGAIPRAGYALVRGRSTATSVAVVAAAMVVGISASAAVRSLDHTLDTPSLYGASWDLVVGNYSQHDTLQAGVDRVRANPFVRAAAGVNDEAGTYSLDGTVQQVVAFEGYKGVLAQTVIAGRAPVGTDEVALGSATMRQLNLHVGDQAVMEFDQAVGSARPVTVVGEAVIMNPIRPAAAADEGVLVAMPLLATFDELAGFGSSRVAQSIVVEFEPTADRQQAVDSILSDFPAGVIRTFPQDDLANLNRIRSLPALIAILVGMLALATATHALITNLLRNRRQLSMLSALGMTRRQVVEVGALGGWMPIAAATILGVPIGILAGNVVWRAAAHSIGIVADPVLAVPAVALIALGASLAALLIGGLTTRRITARSVAADLHSE